MLTLIKKTSSDKQGRKKGLYLCSCGKEKEINITSVTSGNTKSCGCARVMAGKKNGGQNKTHGMGHTGLYNTWRGMITRCHKKTDHRYIDYGGRGITVCKEWQSFEVFYSDMGDKPSMSYSLDRVDNGKGYSRENCRWATRTQQANNKRNNKRYHHNGEYLTIPRWSELLGIGEGTLRSRAELGETGSRLFRPVGKIGSNQFRTIFS